MKNPYAKMDKAMGNCAHYGMKGNRRACRKWLRAWLRKERIFYKDPARCRRLHDATLEEMAREEGLI
jgi:hypothetical protein